MSDEDFKYYSHKVLTDTVCLEIKNNLRPADHVGVTAEKRVKDPISVRAIGTGRFSQASALTEKKRRKCSKCGRLNHRRTHCLNRASQEGGQSCAGGARRCSFQQLGGCITWQHLRCSRVAHVHFNGTSILWGILSLLVDEVALTSCSNFVI
ncbi:uncharacterized protein DS421_17g583880 [Arachis hypogaea]|nr:uncharacterized protein DS421_17g583880 [Arachis hypogaea]